MNNKQRAYLKHLATSLDPIFQIGKNGLSDNQLSSIAESLEVHELMKITYLKNVEEDIVNIAKKIENYTKSEIVQIIGNKIVIYKKSKNKPKIQLP